MECKEENKVAKENLISVEREDGQVRMTLAESVLKFVAGLFKSDPKAAEAPKEEAPAPTQGATASYGNQGTSFNTKN